MKKFGYKHGGFSNKYFITKRDGEDMDPKAEYFVLRLDTDPHALVAMRTYIESVKKDNLELANDLENKIKKYELKGSSNLEIDDDTSLPRDFFEIEIERNSKGYLTDTCINRVISRILAISNYIFLKTRRGRAEEIIFNGKLGRILYKELENMNHLREMEFFFNANPSDGLDSIELVRKGDHFILVPSEDKYPDGSIKLRLKKTREKQPDTIYKILITEKVKK